MKVKLGSLDYDLVLTDKQIDWEDHENVLGKIEEAECKITLQSKLPQQTKEQAFWHETLHGMMLELGQHDLFEDEGFIDSLAKQIHMFVKHNDIKKIYEKLT